MPHMHQAEAISRNEHTKGFFSSSHRMSKTQRSECCGTHWGLRTGLATHMHQAKTAGRSLQPRPKRLFSGVGKYFGRGCKPRPADHGLIKTMSYDLSLMHMGLQPRP
ncbi:Uncharacterized protein dnm_069880 [Desulfonema magnum]|uniref:Uncharacterized protein n=1 Tax=Desulfonema magnum TaxID=45655 RepID=A0A975GRD2_9BACT|nr:Uncharacterized protein dnm_069880 [Desulfonema magnum]